MLKKAMIYLGLGPDEHYEDYDDTARAPGGAPQAGRYADEPGQLSPVRGMGDPGDPSLGRTVRPIPMKTDHGHELGRDVSPMRPGATRPTGDTASGQITRKPHAVSPGDFHGAKEIGDRFKSGQAVIVNLQAVDRALRRRLVDFASGLCYGRDGKMDRVADEVYLLTPAEVDDSSRKPR